MKQLGMKDEEFVCLKALAFLHPEVYFIEFWEAILL